jgi:hypothetical protein
MQQRGSASGQVPSNHTIQTVLHEFSPFIFLTIDKRCLTVEKRFAKIKLV